MTTNTINTEKLADLVTAMHNDAVKRLFDAEVGKSARIEGEIRAYDRVCRILTNPVEFDLFCNEFLKADEPTETDAPSADETEVLAPADDEGETTEPADEVSSNDEPSAYIPATENDMYAILADTRNIIADFKSGKADGFGYANPHNQWEEGIYACAEDLIGDIETMIANSEYYGDDDPDFADIATDPIKCLLHGFKGWFDFAKIDADDMKDWCDREMAELFCEPWEITKAEERGLLTDGNDADTCRNYWIALYARALEEASAMVEFAYDMAKDLYKLAD